MLCVIQSWCSLVLSTAGGDLSLEAPLDFLCINSQESKVSSLSQRTVQTCPSFQGFNPKKNITDALISSSADFIWTAKDWEVTANLWFKIKRVTAQPSFKKLISALWYSLGRKLLLPYICLIKRLSSPAEKLHPDVQFHPFFFCAHWKFTGTG